MVVTAQRRAESEGCREAVGSWAASLPDIRGVAVVGSWARGEPTMDSDLDIVVLTDHKLAYVAADDWIADAAGEPAKVVRRMEWGPLTERRLRLSSGFEVEFGFAPVSWASTDPVDAGTADVVRNGCVPLYDPDLVLADLLAAVH